MKGHTDVEQIRKIVSKIQLPPFVPKQGIQVKVKDDDPVNEDDSMYLYIVHM